MELFINDVTLITLTSRSKIRTNLKLRCDERFTHAFTACGCVFKEITLVGSNQGNYFENATLKTTVATQLKAQVNFSGPKLYLKKSW